MSQTLLLQGCTNDLDSGPKFEDESVSYSYGNERTISETQAIEIANGIVDSGETRSWPRNISAIEYICRKESTRSIDCVSDTLAYVINYENNEGFAIISADNSVFPILAYSHEGNFSMTNEIANENFISNIENYMDADTMVDFRDPKLDEYTELCIVPPIIKCVLGQRSPWDKYVIEEHPGCPVGCVAVATALVVSHSRKMITYNGERFYLSSMISALNESNEEDLSEYDGAELNSGSLIYPLYTYDSAADRMAKLLYWIGKDVNMNYGQNSSSANSTRAFSLCQDLNLSIPSGYTKYDINEITQYLQDDCIIYMRGVNTSGTSGHAWVCDGSMAIVDKKDHSVIHQTYVHCDWGWYGSCNGYYSGDVFAAGSSSYKPMNYFAVSRKPQSSPIEK